jgi:hypothetical protein
MKNLVISMVMLFSLFIFSATSVHAFDDTAKKYFDGGQYEECIKKVESLPDFKKDISNVMLIAFSNLQLYNFTKQKYFNNEYKAYYDMLVAKSGVDQLTNILFFVNSSDKPDVVKASRKLLKEIFNNLYKIEDIVKILPFTKSSDEDVREYAFSAIERIMDPIRDIVKNGGTMRPVDIQYFTNKEVITTAIDNINISKARDILLLIEEPAIPYLENAQGNESLKVHETILKKINDRKKKYPDSSWYSATGKKLE